MRRPPGHNVMELQKAARGALPGGTNERAKGGRLFLRRVRSAP